MASPQGARVMPVFKEKKGKAELARETWILAESLGLNNFCCRHARDLWFEPVAAGLYCIARTFFISEIEKILKFVFKFKFKFELPAQKDVSDLRRSGSIKTENCLWNTMNALIYWSSSLRGLLSSSSGSLSYSCNIHGHSLHHESTQLW